MTMASVKVKNQAGADQGDMELGSSIFGVEINKLAVRQTLNSLLGNRRSGTAKTKTRGEVSFTNAKPWRQKGTGRARAGTARSPLWRGGGTTFGPIPHSYRTKVNRKVRRASICSVLSARVAEESISVVDNLEMSEIKTKRVAEMLKNLGLTEKKTLIVAHNPGVQFLLSARNLPNVQVVVPESLNIIDLLGHEHLLFGKSAVERVMEIYG
jgi:large subunit ribosomal protein L4